MVVIDRSPPILLHPVQKWLCTSRLLVGSRIAAGALMLFQGIHSQHLVPLSTTDFDRRALPIRGRERQPLQSRGHCRIPSTFADSWCIDHTTNTPAGLYGWRWLYVCVDRSTLGRSCSDVTPLRRRVALSKAFLLAHCSV